MARNLVRNFDGVLFAIVLLCENISAQQDVRKPPSILIGPEEHVTFTADHDIVRLQCEAEGIPTVSYQWKKNGIDLLSDQVQILLNNKNGSLTFYPATANDSGYYQCVAKNRFGIAVSNASYLQHVFIDKVGEIETVVQVSVAEGERLRLEFGRRPNSFPKPVFGWENGAYVWPKNGQRVETTKRIQIDENGNLFFAYVTAADVEERTIYKSTITNTLMGVKAYGVNVNVTVKKGPIHNLHPVSTTAEDFQEFSPSLAFASESKILAVRGESFTLRCFFYGYQLPTVSWKGPGDRLPVGRYVLSKSGTELVVHEVVPQDEGEYVCTGNNRLGSREHVIHVTVNAKPTFKQMTDSPFNVNVTETESHTFHCSADAKPKASVVWFRDGYPIDVDNPPKRYTFASDRRSLSVSDVCRDCTDRESLTDLTVIQCNASNIHGYAFRSGYLNVLARTRLVPSEPIEVSVKPSEARTLRFECNAVSDPSTPPTVRWYWLKADNEEQVIHEDPPSLTINDGTLSISVSPNGTQRRDWEFYRGEYHCVASNGYSQARRVVKIDVEYQLRHYTVLWWTYLIITISCLLVILIVVLVVLLVSRKRRENSERLPMIETAEREFASFSNDR